MKNIFTISTFVSTSLTRFLLTVACISGVSLTLSAQIVVSFQGGEVGDTWGFTSTGASALAISEATQTQNKVSGTTSLVVGGNTGGGNCFSTGSGNGPNTPRTFTFDQLDISSSNSATRTLTFNWGNRFPACSGTGWDSGENLVFIAYHNGVAQSPVTLATGNNNAQFSILSNSYTWLVPPCVSQFYFVVSIITNRADELLLIDNVILMAPQLNGSFITSSISGNTSVCLGATENYNVTPDVGISYTWSGLPAGANFTSINGTMASSVISVSWGTTPSGIYTLSVTPSNSCSVIGSPQTISVTILPVPAPLEILGPTSLCNGEIITLNSSYASGNTWSPGGLTSSSISVTTPGTYTVSTSTSCGVITDTYTVTLNPAPTIQSVTNTPISCFGSNDGSLTILSTESGLEYSLDGIIWQTSNVFTNLFAGTYTPQVRYVGGCSIFTSPIQFIEPPAVIAIASTAGMYCEGTVISLNGTTTTLGTPSFSWTGTNGFTSTLQNPTDILPAGSYTYELIVSVNGCQSNSSSTHVTIQPIPVVNISNTGPYCAGDGISINSTTPSTGIVTYSWTGPNNYSSANQNPSDATQAGNYELVINANGCQSSPVITTIIINPLPVAQAGYVSPFCTGSLLQLNGYTTSTNVVSYSWIGPNGYTSNLQNPSDGLDAGIYTLTAATLECTSLPSNVNVIPEVPQLTVTNTGPYCEGETIQLNGSSSSISSISYLWTGPNGYTSQVQNPSDATFGGIYTLSISANNCSAIASTIVRVNPNPIVSFSSSATCVNDNVIFTSLSTALFPEIITDWSWDFNDGFGSYEENPKHLFGNSGIYSVLLKVTTASNCTASISQEIEVKPGIDADFYYSPTTITLLAPTVHFVNTSSNATSYIWDFDSENIQSTEFSPEFIFPDKAGSYSVQLIAFNDEGCKDSITKIITIKDDMFYYVPNAFTPDGNEFNQTFKPIFSNGFDTQNFTLSIYNRWGETIFESHDSDLEWDGTYDGTIVPEGTYIWNIKVKHLYNDAFEIFSGHVSLIR